MAQSRLHGCCCCVLLRPDGLPEPLSVYRIDEADTFSTDCTAVPTLEDPQMIHLFNHCLGGGGLMFFIL